MARTDPRPHYGAKRRIRSDGYIDVWDPEHPLARNGGYVAEHRKVAWDAGILTDPAADVHHLNGDRGDNRPENLAQLAHGAHASAHVHERGAVTNQHGTFAVVEHGAAAYRAGRCRCDACRAENTRVCREYRQRRRERVT